MLAKRPQHRNWFNCTRRNLLQAGFFAGSKSQWDNFSLWLNQTDRPPGNWASPAHLEIIVRYLNWKIYHHCTLQAHSAIRMKRNYAKHPNFIHFAVCLLFDLVVKSVPPAHSLPVSLAIIKSLQSTELQSGEQSSGLSCRAPGLETLHIILASF